MSDMIGKRIKYSIQKDILSVGVIKDCIMMKEKSDDQVHVTGYLIEDESSHELKSIAHWRLISIIEH